MPLSHPLDPPTRQRDTPTQMPPLCSDTPRNLSIHSPERHLEGMGFWNDPPCLTDQTPRGEGRPPGWLQVVYRLFFGAYLVAHNVLHLPERNVSFEGMKPMDPQYPFENAMCSTNLHVDPPAKARSHTQPKPHTHRRAGAAPRLPVCFFAAQQNDVIANDGGTD